MKHTPRLFNCARCQAQTVICSHCDRGQIYCADCANKARHDSCRAAEKRYQNTHKGRLKHAARQQRYRAKSKKVTDQGSPFLGLNDLLELVKNKAKEDIGTRNERPKCCDFCQKSVELIFRQQFLRHSISKRTPNWPYLGPS